MDTNNDRLLSPWYEYGCPEEGTVFIARHSSACQYDAFEGVCEYQLYPILKKDADLLLYQLIKDLVMHPDFKEYLNTINLSGSSINFNYHEGEHEEWSRPYLLFPADDRITTYYKEELQWPYIVGASSMYYHAYGESGLIDEDEYPLFRVYYIVKWDYYPEGSIVKYVEYFRRGEYRMSKMENNVAALNSAIRSVLEIIPENEANLVSWRNRLKSSMEMIKTHANELHILHQAGLYDLQGLWNIMREDKIDDEQFEWVRKKLETELHRYAMLVVNLIDWKMTGFDSSQITTAIPKHGTNCDTPHNSELGYKKTNEPVKTFGNNSESQSDGYDWDSVWPKYPFERGNMDPEEYEAKRREWLWKYSR